MNLEFSQVDIWLARDPQLRDAALLESFSRSLPADEHARVARMHFPEDRHQQLVTRGLVRNVLSRYVPGMAPADWRFARNQHDRPHIAGAPDGARDLQFNLAHTRGLVVMAVTRAAEIGVDVERASATAPLDVAQRYFSPAEIAALSALPVPEQPRRFHRLWTLKEAYLKAIGIGITEELGSMTFSFDGNAVRFARAADPDAARWAFREINVADEFLLALAYLDRGRVTSPKVTLRQFPVGFAADSGKEKSAQA